MCAHSKLKLHVGSFETFIPVSVAAMTVINKLTNRISQNARCAKAKRPVILPVGMDGNDGRDFEPNFHPSNSTRGRISVEELLKITTNIGGHDNGDE
jgi:hypothetical protein